MYAYIYAVCIRPLRMVTSDFRLHMSVLEGEREREYEKYEREREGERERGSHQALEVGHE